MALEMLTWGCEIQIILVTFAIKRSEEMKQQLGRDVSLKDFIK